MNDRPKLAVEPGSTLCQHELQAGPRKGQRCGKRKCWGKDTCSAHDPMGQLKLTAETRRRLFEGQRVEIGGDGEAPIEPGFVYVLAPHFTLTVQQITVGVRTEQPKSRRRGSKPVKVPTWKIKQYRLHDSRVKVKLLKQRTGTDEDYDELRELHAPENFAYDVLPGLSDEEVAQAHVDSNYTANPLSALPHEPEPVDEDTLNQFALEANQRFIAARVTDVSAIAALPIAERLASIKTEAAQRGIPLGRELRELEHAISKMEKKLARRAA